MLKFFPVLPLVFFYFPVFPSTCPLFPMITLGRQLDDCWWMVGQKHIKKIRQFWFCWFCKNTIVASRDFTETQAAICSWHAEYILNRTCGIRIRFLVLSWQGIWAFFGQNLTGIIPASQVRENAVSPFHAYLCQQAAIINTDIVLIVSKVDHLKWKPSLPLKTV
jgi:hypothetical protein